MKVRVFTLPWRPEAGGFEDGEVQEFLASRTALDVSEHFFVHEKMPVLVLVVTYRDGAPVPRSAGRAAGGGIPASEPPPDLTPDERRRFEALRAWRNQYARRVGRPPYAILTNRQAVEIVRRVPASRAELGEVQGIGASRLEEFGDELLALLASMPRVDGEVQGG